MENHQIKCGVRDCTHNSNAQYCQLQSICVGTNTCNEVTPNTCETTECNSYECRSSASAH